MRNMEIASPSPIELDRSILADDATPLPLSLPRLPTFRLSNLAQWRSSSIAKSDMGILPATAEKKLQAWIRSRHVICAGNFFIFETIDYAAIDHFSMCVVALGGAVISVDSLGKIRIGDLCQVILYQTKASLHTPHHHLKQYWIKYGSFRTKFDRQT